MRITILSIAFLLAVTCSFGQTTFGLKVYQNTDYFNVAVYNRESNLTRNVKVLNFDRISLACSWQQGSKWTHEIEVFIPEILKSAENLKLPFEHEFREGYGMESDASSYSLRYDISRILISLSKRFDFKLGMGVNPYFIKTDYTPTISYVYPLHTTVIGASVNFVPRINFKITNRILLDLNFPFKIYDLSERMVRIQNPSIPVQHQKSSETSNTFFDNVYTVRFGIEFLLQEKTVRRPSPRK